MSEHRQTQGGGTKGRRCPVCREFHPLSDEAIKACRKRKGDKRFSDGFRGRRRDRPQKFKPGARKRFRD